MTFKVGRSGDALEAHRAVLTMREQLAADPRAEWETKADVARSLTAVASLLDSAGKIEDALATYRRAEAVLMAGPVGAESLVQAELAACRTGIGFANFKLGRVEDAIVAYRQARVHQEALVTALGASADRRYDMANTAFHFGGSLYFVGRLSEAEAECRTATGMLRKLIDEYPEVPAYRGALADNQLIVCALQLQAGRLAAAEAECRDALALLQKLVVENPAVTRFRWSLACGRGWLGDLLATTGRSGAAEAECREAMVILRTLVDENPAIILHRTSLAMAHDGLSERLLERSQPAAAEAESRTALAIHQQLADENRATWIYGVRLAGSYVELGDVLRVLGRSDDARRCYERAIATADGLPASENSADCIRSCRSVLGSSLRRRGLVLREMGDPAGAAAATKQALALKEGLPPSPSNLTEIACCHAALAGLAGRAGSGVTVAEGEGEAARAMEWLGRMVTIGYRNADQLRIESALDPLRGRPDFKRLVAELEKRTPAAHEKK